MRESPIMQLIKTQSTQQQKGGQRGEKELLSEIINQYYHHHKIHNHNHKIENDGDQQRQENSLHLEIAHSLARELDAEIQSLHRTISEQEHSQQASNRAQIQILQASLQTSQSFLDCAQNQSESLTNIYQTLQKDLLEPIRGLLDRQKNIVGAEINLLLRLQSYASVLRRLDDYVKNNKNSESAGEGEMIFRLLLSAVEFNGYFNPINGSNNLLPCRDGGEGRRNKDILAFLQGADRSLCTLKASLRSQVVHKFTLALQQFQQCNSSQKEHFKRILSTNALIMDLLECTEGAGGCTDSKDDGKVPVPGCLTTSYVDWQLDLFARDCGNAILKVKRINDVMSMVLWLRRWLLLHWSAKGRVETGRNENPQEQESEGHSEIFPKGWRVEYHLMAAVCSKIAQKVAMSKVDFEDCQDDVLAVLKSVRSFEEYLCDYFRVGGEEEEDGEGRIKQIDVTPLRVVSQTLTPLLHKILCAKTSQLTKHLDLQTQKSKSANKQRKSIDDYLQDSREFMAMLSDLISSFVGVSSDCGGDGGVGHALFVNIQSLLIKHTQTINQQPHNSPATTTQLLLHHHEHIIRCIEAMERERVETFQLQSDCSSSLSSSLQAHMVMVTRLRKQANEGGAGMQ